MRDSRSGSRQWGTPPAHPQLSKCQKKQVVIEKVTDFGGNPTYPKPQDLKLITCNESYIQPILSHLFHFNVCHGLPLLLRLLFSCGLDAPEASYLQD
jgi:hypothetical protein